MLADNIITYVIGISHNIDISVFNIVIYPEERFTFRELGWKEMPIENISVTRQPANITLLYSEYL